MLPAGISVVADVRHILDIHREQRELARHRTPADLSGHRGSVAPLHVLITLGAHGPPHLHLRRRLRAGDDAVQHDPPVPGKIGGLGGRAHHRQPQIAVHDQRFNPADPRRPVTPDGTGQKDTRPDQPVEHDGAKSRLAGRYR
jgi:hypothetical protein